MVGYKILNTKTRKFASVFIYVSKEHAESEISTRKNKDVLVAVRNE